MLGVYPRKADRSLRVCIPKRFLSDYDDSYIGQTVYIAVEYACYSNHLGLLVFSEREYESQKDDIFLLAQIASKQLSCEELLPVKRTIDKRGRIALPRRLAEYASINAQSDVYCIGVADHFEIWNTYIWDQIDGSVDTNEMLEVFKKISEDL